MRNVVILGSGRSGTSMVAGSLAQSGYFMGSDLWAARASNPKGFFEDREINQINEDLLASLLPARPWLIGKWFFRDRFVNMQRWLARIPVGTPVPSSENITARIQKLTRQPPFCFKDPRFCYTLPAWRPHLDDAVFVVVFRDPASTVKSILKVCQDEPYLEGLPIDVDQALAGWTLMYRHILERHRHTGEWLWLHYNQVLQPSGLDRLEAFVGAPVDRGFPDAALQRSVSDRAVPAATREIYQQLCDLAGYRQSAGK